MSEKKDNNLIEINKKNLTKKKLNDKNVEESKELNEETTENLLSIDLINQINLNYEDENSNNINFNINPFNNNEKELTDNNSNSSDNDLMFVENDIQNNFNPEKIDLTEYLKQQSLQNDDNLNYFEENKEKGKKNVYSQLQTTFSLNNNKPIPRVPSNPIPASYLGNFNINNNIENSLNSFDFYQNNYSHSNSNLNLGNIMFPNNSFSMNGKYGWICSNCENFNYESKIFFI